MWIRLLVAISLLLAGCARSVPSPPATSDPTPSTDQAQIQPTQSPATAPDAPLRRQVLEATEKLHARRFSGLLHFETKADAIFVAAEPSKPHVKRGEAHTGNSMLLLAPGTRRLTVKLSSLLTGREFPGEWTLLGLYVRPDEPTSATLSCKVDGRVIAARNVSLPGGDWSPAMLDLAALPNPVPPGREATLELRLDQPATGNVRIDDVLLINNRQTLVDAGPEGWTVKRAGLRVICERKQRFNLGVVTRDGSPQGWEVEEANELRARFSSSGETTALTVYADGRSFWDGVYQPLSADVRDDKTFAAAHAAPAEIALPETMGRIDRSTQGDMNNDGYNEQLGAYQLQASGGRLELTISPRGAPVPRPVLQIAGMPEGKALITIEGKLVERSTRLPEGQLLVELPARITRATLVTIRIQ